MFSFLCENILFNIFDSLNFTNLENLCFSNRFLNATTNKYCQELLIDKIRSVENSFQLYNTLLNPNKMKLDEGQIVMHVSINHLQKYLVNAPYWLEECRFCNRYYPHIVLEKCGMCKKEICQDCLVYHDVCKKCIGKYCSLCVKPNKNKEFVRNYCKYCDS